MLKSETRFEEENTASASWAHNKTEIPNLASLSKLKAQETVVILSKERSYEPAHKNWCDAVQSILISIIMGIRLHFAIHVLVMFDTYDKPTKKKCKEQAV